MPVQFSDARPGMALLDTRHNLVRTVVGVNHEAGKIWLTDEARGLSDEEFNTRRYEEHKASAAENPDA